MSIFLSEPQPRSAGPQAAPGKVSACLRSGFFTIPSFFQRQETLP